jgi:hypothetical protein
MLPTSLRKENYLLFVADEMMQYQEREITALVLYGAKKVGMCDRGASE